MENCQNGCPCKYFDCDLSLDESDSVRGLESLGVLETTGTLLQQIIRKITEYIKLRSNLQRGMH